MKKLLGMIGLCARAGKLTTGEGACEKLIRSGKPVEQIRQALSIRTLSPIQQQWLKNRLSKADFSEAMRLNYYLGRILPGAHVLPPSRAYTRTYYPSTYIIHFLLDFGKEICILSFR